MAKQHSPQFLKLAEAAKAEVRELTCAQLVDRLKQPGSLLLLDVREDHEWQLGHIPGATHLGRGILERDIEQTCPDFNREIVVYCGGGFRSALAAVNLAKMGYSRVTSLAGGYTGWSESGLPIEGTKP